MTAGLPDEFQPSALVERIILGAIQADKVRLHGAIVAALELHGADAHHTIFAAALDEAPRRAVGRRGIRLRIARRNTRNGSGLGRYRWRVEQAFALLHRYRRLATCYDRTIETNRALVGLACCLICGRRLERRSSACAD